MALLHHCRYQIVNTHYQPVRTPVFAAASPKSQQYRSNYRYWNGIVVILERQNVIQQQPPEIVHAYQSSEARYAQVASRHPSPRIQFLRCYMFPGREHIVLRQRNTPARSSDPLRRVVALLRIQTTLQCLEGRSGNLAKEGTAARYGSFSPQPPRTRRHADIPPVLNRPNCPRRYSPALRGSAPIAHAPARRAPVARYRYWKNA